MRKAFALVAVVALVGMTSCKKDYTCTCTTTDSSGTIPTQTTTRDFNAKKKDAKEACEALNSTVGTLKTECKI